MNDVIASDFIMPYSANHASAEEAGIATEGVPPPFSVLCFRPTLRLSPTAETLICRGDCLRPWLVEGDMVWFDRTVEPRLGDVVACRLKYRCQEGPAKGKLVELTALKQLVRVGSKLGLAAVDDVIDANDAEILGPVTAWHRRGWWKRPSPRRMSFPLPR